ncbi:BnaC06g04950D [Brassica napus]|uniref:BnaC06g04950D protein n=1 Tax=Brassica napus TaxID=3708 RepID=A0A078HAJ4_BRANA|nr:BnaC06g04950D [Brassica napus]
MAESPKYIEPYDCREAVAISPKLSLSFVLLNPGLQRIPPVFKPSDGLSGSHVSKSAGPFDALICVGQFFPDSPELLGEFLDYVEGRAQVLIPT